MNDIRKAKSCLFKVTLLYQIVTLGLAGPCFGCVVFEIGREST